MKAWEKTSDRFVLEAFVLENDPLRVTLDVPSDVAKIPETVPPNSSDCT